MSEPKPQRTPDPEHPPTPPKPHRWDTREASAAGRKGGSARRWPKGMGKGKGK